jgi:hypothetical protein
MDVQFNAPTVVPTVMDTTPRVGITHEEAVAFADFMRYLWVNGEQYGPLRQLIDRVDAYLEKRGHV